MDRRRAIDIDNLIDNWCRWHWSAMRWHRGRCHSLESKYRSPQPWDAPPINPKGKVNVLDAQKVEDAWRTLSFVPKIILKQHYVFRLYSGRITRQLRKKGFPVLDKDYELELERAKNNLLQALAKPKSSGISKSNAVVCVQTPRWEGVGRSKIAA